MIIFPTETYENINFHSNWIELKFPLLEFFFVGKPNLGFANLLELQILICFPNCSFHINIYSAQKISTFCKKDFWGNKILMMKEERRPRVETNGDSCGSSNDKVDFNQNILS